MGKQNRPSLLGVTLRGGPMLLLAGCLAGVNANGGSGDGNASSLVGAGTEQGDYFVSPDGKDSNAGTADHPFATVAKAQAMVRTQLLPSNCKGRTTPIVVVLRGGTYTNTSLDFAKTDSGCANAPITYENYSGEVPVLSGGVQLTKWKKINGAAICAGNTNCWQKSLPSTTPYFEALYYNGQRRFRPRMGATAGNLLGTWGHVASGLAGATGFVYDAGDPVAEWSNGVTGDIEYWDFEKWVVNVQRIKSIATGSRTIESTCSGNTCPSSGAGEYGKGHRYLIENVKSLLKLAGQWFLDRSGPTWELTYLGNPGEDPNTDIVMVPYNDQVLTMDDVENVTFSGITFEHDNYAVPTGGYASQQLDFTIPAMVSCTACTNVKFDTCTFTQTVGNGLEIEGTSSNVTVTNSLLTDIGGYGIRVGTTPNTTSTDSEVPHDITITQNTIDGVSRFFPSSDGIGGGLSNNVEIAFNDIHDSYHDAVEYCKPQGGPCGGGNNHGDFNLDVHDNNFYDAMQGVTDDGGCFYTMTSTQENGGNNGEATGNRYFHNLCHDVSDASTQEAGGYGGHGAYFDQYTGNWDVEDNLIYRVTAVALNMTYGPQVDGYPMTFKNNILAYANQGFVGVLECPPSRLAQLKFTNNIVYTTDSSPSIQRPGSAAFDTADPTHVQEFASNVYYDPSYGFGSSSNKAFYYDAGPAMCGGETKLDFAAWQEMGEEAGTIIKQPAFKDPSYPADDYSLPSGTPGAGFVPFALTFGKTSHLTPTTVASTFITKPYVWPGQ